MRGILIFNIVLGILAMIIGTLALIRGSHLTALGMGFVLLSNIIQIIQGYINNKKSKAQED
jgi:Na+-translocating ferredoxin:NAD+ oxidoreductase RnfD subunit